MDTPYIMDDPREAARLADKVDAVDWVSRYLRDHLFDGAAVLSVGCGPGVIDEEIGNRNPSCSLACIDISPERAGETRRRTTRFRSVVVCGDAQHLPFASNTFDIVYCRFLLEYLKDKSQAVSEMVRVCRTGGRVLTQDLDGQLMWHYPENHQMQTAIQTIVASLANTGFDPLVGRKLFNFAFCAGLGDISVRVEPYHLVAGSVDADNDRLWQTKLSIAEPAIAHVLGSKSLDDKLLSSSWITYAVLTH